MGYSQNMTLGEIAYDGYHAISEEYTPFWELTPRERHRWAQAARNSRDAMGEAGGLRDASVWRMRTRDAHAPIRELMKDGGTDPKGYDWDVNEAIKGAGT